ncbi:MAG: TonB-dependent receptor [Vicinamibacterales bacterium]
MLWFARCTFVVLLSLIAAAPPASAQQRGSITGKITDPDGLALPGATVTVTNQATGTARDTVTAENGAYSIVNIEPGTYTVSVEMPSFASMKRTDLVLAAGQSVVLEFKLQLGGLTEAIDVTGQAPLVEKTSNQLGGSLTAQEIQDVPSNFRNFTALTQLIPGMTPNPAASSFEGGQVVANGTPSQGNVYLLDGMYNNDDRLGGSQGTQVRVVLDNIAEYQVLSNQYSAEYGGGAGAIINMVSRGGTNQFRGRAYNYFRDERFNNRNAFVPSSQPKPDELTLQTGFALGGPIIRDKAHFYFTIERDFERIQGQKLFPAVAAPLARDMLGAFTVNAKNYFARGDYQINSRNFLNLRMVLETAPTKGEGFNTSNETLDAQGWESDFDRLFSGSYTSVLSDRASNVIRVGNITERLNTGAQAFFMDDVTFVGFDGRDPFSIGQRNTHPSYITGKGGTGTLTKIRTYTFDDSFSYFLPSWGGEHTMKFGGGFSLNQAPARGAVSSGIYQFRSDLPYNPADPATYPFQFDATVGPASQVAYEVAARDRRGYVFFEDKWRVSNNLTLNLGVRTDSQKITPNDKFNVAPRAGFAWDVTGDGTTVVRGGVGKFYAYMPISVDLNLQQSGVLTLFPDITVSDPNSPILRPDVITDSQGNLGVAQMSAAGLAELNRLRDSVLAGSTFNRNPIVDDPNRKLPYTVSWSIGLTKQIGAVSAIGADYVANISRDQLGQLDINEPVNRVRPGVDVFDPNGIYIPAEARGTNFQRVRLYTTNPAFNGDYRSMQLSYTKRMANRWSGRLAYTLQKSNYTGLGNPDARRVWLDNDPKADYGRFASDRRHVLAGSAVLNVWRTFNVATVVSMISNAPINETVGRDVNGDQDNTDRPIAGVDDLTMPIRSALDSQGRAVINGLKGPNSRLVDLSFRYSLPVHNKIQSLDFFYDIFNIFNRTNLVAPTGNRSSANFMVPIAAQFPRQMQFGIRVMF